MREGLLLYFSEEEFALMMELAGGKEYALFLEKQELDDHRLAEAFTSLFRRELLVNAEDSFAPSQKGAFFRELRMASHIVLIRSAEPEPRTMLCYVRNRTAWLAELLEGSPSERYRLSKWSCGKLVKWLLEMGVLPRPILKDEDIEELECLLSDKLELVPEGEAAVRITKCSSSGAQLCEYLLYLGEIGWLLRINDGENVTTHLYTQDNMRKMLRQCFGG